MWHSSSQTCLTTQQSVCLLAKTVVCLQYLEWKEKFVVHRRCTSRWIRVLKTLVAICGIAPVSGLQKDAKNDFPTCMLPGGGVLENSGSMHLLILIVIASF